MIEVGQVFGRLTVLGALGRINRTTYWYCRCDCGQLREVRHGQLQSGRTKSCGCLREQVCGDLRRIHGRSTTKEYRSWAEAKSRCRPDSEKRKWYFDRGITFCAEWENDFLAFLSHMGQKPDGTSLDRIDNEKGYEPGNCRWATKLQQANNTDSNRQITALNKTQSLAQWSAETGLKTNTISKRLAAGWSPEKSLTLRPNQSRFGKTPWNKGKNAKRRLFERL